MHAVMQLLLVLLLLTETAFRVCDHGMSQTGHMAESLPFLSRQCTVFSSTPGACEQPCLKQCVIEDLFRGFTRLLQLQPGTMQETIHDKLVQGVDEMAELVRQHITMLQTAACLPSTGLHSCPFQAPLCPAYLQHTLTDSALVLCNWLQHLGDLLHQPKHEKMCGHLLLLS